MKQSTGKPPLREATTGVPMMKYPAPRFPEIHHHPFPAPSLGVPHEPVVYYAMTRFDSVVKIGTTVNLARRFVQLNKGKIPLSPLVVESGAEPLERLRHLQFGGSRFSGEYFWLTDDLRDYMVLLADSVAFVEWALSNTGGRPNE